MSSIEAPPRAAHRLPAELAERVALYDEVEEDRFAFPDVKDPGFVRVVKYMVSPGGRAGLCKIRAPHAFDVAMVTSSPGEGPPLHMHTYPEVFTCLSGRYGIRWGNAGEHVVELDPLDTFSAPPNVMRQVMNISTDRTGTSMAIWDHHDPKNAIYHPTDLVQAELAAGKSTGRKPGVGATMPVGEMEKYTARYAELWGGAYRVDRGARQDVLGETALVISPAHRAGHARIAEPHSYHMLMSRAGPGDRTRPYARDHTEVLIGGRGRFALRMGADLEHRVELGMLDTVSVPAGLLRQVECLEGAPGVLMTMLDTPAAPW